VTDGTVIIIGGAEDKVRDRVILNRFVTLAGGRDATIVVISTASSLGTEAGERYRQIFPDLGVTTLRPIPAATRPQANDTSLALALRDATGVFLTGGNQLRLASQVGGTRLADAMLDQFRHSAVTSGTDAGSAWQPHDRVRASGATRNTGWPIAAG
jgi:cyanophycinase